MIWKPKLQHSINAIFSHKREEFGLIGDDYDSATARYPRK